MILLLLSALLRDRADDERCPIEGDGEIERGDRNDSRKDDDEPPPKADDETSPPATGSLERVLLEIGTEDDGEETHEKKGAPDIMTKIYQWFFLRRRFTRQQIRRFNNKDEDVSQEDCEE